MKRCFLNEKKHRIQCTCWYRGTEDFTWVKRYQRYTVRYCKWKYGFLKRMTGIDVEQLFGISKHMVYRIYKNGIQEELIKQEAIQPAMISIGEISRKKGH